MFVSGGTSVFTFRESRNKEIIPEYFLSEPMKLQQNKIDLKRFVDGKIMETINKTA